MNMVRYTKEQLPSLSEVRSVELKQLAALPDEKIDYSDIPELTESFWEVATRSNLYKPVKRATTVRLDEDVLLWLKSRGKGYQTRINGILRDAMLGSMH